MSNSPEQSPQTNLEASISQLSLHSDQSGANEDWDQSIREDSPGAGPSTPPPGHQTLHLLAENEKTPGDNSSNFGTRGKKSLSEMLKRHCEKGRSLNLSDEDEENLSEELGKWINSNSSPYELDDNIFPSEKDETRSRAGSTVNKDQDMKREPSSATA